MTEVHPAGGQAAAREALRRRIAAAAAEEFARNGIGATGMTRLAAAARASKRTIYEEFGSKEGLVAAALAAGDEPVFAALFHGAEGRATPAEEVLAVFEEVARRAEGPGYRGCPYLNAAAEGPHLREAAREVARAHKRRTRAWLVERVAAEDVVEPGPLADGLLVLLDGALASCALHQDPAPARAAAAAARTLLAQAPRA